MGIKKVLTIIFLITALLLVACSNNSDDSLTGGSVTSLDKEDDSIRIPINSITEDLQKHEYTVDDVNVRYFIVEGTDGEIRTAFDACDVCGSRGYIQNDNEIVCNKCGLSFEINGIGTQNKGYGCWPGYLPHEIVGDEIVIKTSDLESGVSRFI